MSDEVLKTHFLEEHPSQKIKYKVICPKENHRCEICYEEFTSIVFLNEHMEDHDDQYTCEICKIGFKRVLDYILHNSHSSEEGYNCVICNYKCLLKNRMILHVDQHVFNKSIYKCDICLKRFNIYRYLQEHQAVHTGEKPYMCEACGASFPLTNYLHSHIRNRHPELIFKEIPCFECPRCDKSFNQKRYLNHHIKLHHENNKPIQCELCGKQFNSLTYLKNHTKIHLGIKNFKCLYCDKTFVTSRRLQVHTRIHTGEKPYECQFCQKRFNQINSKKVHERIHTNERPYVCHLCNNGFISRGVLNNHLSKCTGA